MTVAVDLPSARPRGRGPASSGRRRLGVVLLRHARFVLGIGSSVVLLAVVLPAVAGIGWSGFLATVTSVSPEVLLGLLALWAGGLGAHTIALTAALPGLSARRAATLSLTGSAVANVLPVGGAAGVALNVRMGRAWGFDGPAMSRYTVVTNVWDVLAKVLLPVVVLPVVLASGIGVRQVLAAAVTAGVGAVVLAAAAAVLLRPSAAVAVGRGIDHVLTRVARRPRGWEQRMHHLQVDTWALVRRRWARLSLGMALYTGALLALMVACFAATGAALSLPAVVTAFVLERLLTLAGLTPGGAGLVEVAVTGLLVGMGASATTAAAGILLYRALTMVLEVPVGAVWLLIWSWIRWRPAGRAAAAGRCGDSNAESTTHAVAA